MVVEIITPKVLFIPALLSPPGRVNICLLTTAQIFETIL